MEKTLAIFLVVVGLVVFGCGGGVDPQPPPPPISVSVAPSAANVPTGGNQQFTATVSNTGNQAVTWQVNGIAGGNATVGTISANGMYSAPTAVPNPAAVSITAVSQADPSKSGSATATIVAVAVDVKPDSANVQVGNTQQFTATVTGSPNTAVTWSIDDIRILGVGTINANGLYTAPANVPNPATVKIKAVSQADPTKSDTSLVTILPPPPPTITSVTASCASLQVQAGQTTQCSAVVQGTGNFNPAVNWFVNDILGGNAVVGTMNATGAVSFYVAPAFVPSPPTVTVKAVSVQDSLKFGTAPITVTAAAGQPTLLVSRVMEAGNLLGAVSFNDAGGNPLVVVSGNKIVNVQGVDTPVGVVKALRVSDLTDVWEYSLSPVSSGFGRGVLLTSDQKIAVVGGRLSDGALLLSRVNPVTGQALSEQACDVPNDQPFVAFLRERTRLHIGDPGASSTDPSRIVSTPDLTGPPNCASAVVGRSSGELEGFWVGENYFLLSGTFGTSPPMGYARKVLGNGAFVWERQVSGVFGFRVVEQVENGVPVVYIAGTGTGLLVLGTDFTVYKFDQNLNDLWPAPVESRGNNNICTPQSNVVHALIPNPGGGITVIGQWESLDCGSLDFAALVVNPDGTVKHIIRSDFQGGFEEAFGGAYDSTGKKLILVGRRRPNATSFDTNLAVAVWQLP